MKLDPTKAQVDVRFIDRVEQPTAGAPQDTITFVVTGLVLSIDRTAVETPPSPNSTTRVV